MPIAKHRGRQSEAAKTPQLEPRKAGKQQKKRITGQTDFKNQKENRRSKAPDHL